MKILDGGALIDGGTTSVQFELGSQIRSITIVYSQPQQEGKPRVIWTGAELYAYDRQLEVNSDEEKSLLLMLKNTCMEKFGQAAVNAYIHDPTKPGGENHWFYAMFFLHRVYNEREHL